MKTLLTLLLGIVCLAAYPQQKKKHIDTRPLFYGVGAFKIGIDTSDLIKFARDSDLWVHDIYTNESYNNAKENTTREVFRLKPIVGSDDVPGTTTYCPDVNEYFIGRLKISGVELTGISLKFYKGKLISFLCDDSFDLTDAMSIKYGKPEITVTKKEVSCLYKLTGITTKLVKESFLSSWNGYKEISVFESVNKDYDDHCEPTHFSYFIYAIRVIAIEKWDENHEYNGLPKLKKDLKNF